MKVAVWDTYVPRRDGRVMHFDIIVPYDLQEEQKIFTFGKEYLRTKGEAHQPLQAEECQFCHIEQAAPPVVESIRRTGYYILEMENCT